MLRWRFSQNNVLWVVGDCWAGRRPALGLPLNGQRKGRRRQACLLHRDASGCPRTFKKHFRPAHHTSGSDVPIQAEQTFPTGRFPMNFLHVVSPQPLLPSCSPISPSISPSHFLLLLSQLKSVYKTTILLSLLLSYLTRNCSGLHWFSGLNRFQPFLLLSLGPGREQGASHCRGGGARFPQVNSLNETVRPQSRVAIFLSYESPELSISNCYIQEEKQAWNVPTTATFWSGASEHFPLSVLLLSPHDNPVRRVSFHQGSQFKYVPSIAQDISMLKYFLNIRNSDVSVYPIFLFVKPDNPPSSPYYP